MVAFLQPQVIDRFNICIKLYLKRCFKFIVFCILLYYYACIFFIFITYFALSQIVNCEMSIWKCEHIIICGLLKRV